MRSLIAASILCFISGPALACVFDTDCKPGTSCVDGVCTHVLNSDDDTDNSAPAKPATSKSCEYDSDCKEGARCIRGSGLQGVCIGR